ncbi:hypothetical protein BZG36_02279 [Bifiguratus adelaidae]|uniref:PCI domain-containing protein n=1 Tax=Bifiguratus adelaidae TaxID=1938954 RepID=A0A261XY69_9FUNG|nr:hypothetical protein BZG36_02279 [Bifiguratus adelaidae]
MSIQALKQEYEALQRQLQASNYNVQQCTAALTKLRINLVKAGAFKTGAQASDVELLTLARDVLETGAYLSLRAKDVAAFERYIAQLNTFYTDYSKLLPPSKNMYHLIGLNLLRFLSQNKLSEFHTALEVIDPDELHKNPHIKQAVDLEQYLMEGSYNKVWNTRSSISGEEFALFHDILIATIRNEIAGCSEKAYDALPLQDAATLLFFKSLEELLNFANERGWEINPAEQKIFFNATNTTENAGIPQDKIIRQTLTYARELERIV